MSYIVLNDNRIEIEGQVIEKQISPWSAKMSMGSEEFGDFMPCSIREYADLRGGIGLENEEKESDRLWWSESMETTKDRYTVLGPEVVNAGTINTAPLKILDFESTTYILGNSTAHYWNGTALVSADANALVDPTDAMAMIDSTDAYLITCNGGDVRYCSVGYGGSSDWATLSNSDVTYMASYDKRLIGVDTTGTTVFYSARDNIDDAAGGAMSSFSISGDWAAAKDLWAGKLLTTDEPVLYMLTDTGLIAIDFWTRTSPKMEVRFPTTDKAFVGMYWNSDIYCATGAGIRKVSPNLTSPFGPDQDDGLPTEIVGYVYDMIGTAHWIVIAVSGGTKSTILKRHESLGSWHEVYTSSSAIRCLFHSALTSPGLLWFGEGNNVSYLQFPDKTHDVTKVSGYTYNTSGSLIYPRLSKLSIIPKTAIAVEALTENCSANVTIPIFLRVDDTASWGSAIGTFNTSGHPTPISLGSGLGTAFNDIQLKTTMTSNSNATTPILKSLALKFIPNPSVVSSWTFNIAARGDEAKKIITDLETARDKTTLVNFSPVGDTDISEKFVKVESLPSRQELGDYRPEKHYTVVVSEPS